MFKFHCVMFAVLAIGECTVCPSGYVFIENGCFKAYYYINTSWEHAEDLCGFDGANLAIIKSCSLLGKLATFFHMTGSESTAGYWIAATDSVTEGDWRWSDGTAVALGVPFWGTTENWTLQPDGGINENCAQLSPSDQYYFHDENCDKEGNTLCQMNPLYPDEDLEKCDLRHSEQEPEELDEPFCTDGFDWVNGTCFYVLVGHHIKLTWRDARDFCQNNKSSDLAVIKDCTLFGILVVYFYDIYPLNKGESYWLGAADEGEEGSWYWVDYSPVMLGPPYWGSTNGTPEPSGGDKQNCAAMYKDDAYYFHDVECDGLSHVICQKEPT